MSAPEIPATTEDIDEAGSLAMELANAYQEMVTSYSNELGLTGHDADLRARGLDVTPEDAAEDMARIKTRPPDQISWFELNRLANRDPEEAVAAWQRIKDEARKELSSGHRSAQALDWQRSPWARARFLAIRDDLSAGHPPQNGTESALLDTAAEAFSDYLYWSGHLHMQASAEVESERASLQHDGGWSLPRRSTAEAIEQSSRMVERAHARFLKTIKMLHELQRSTPTLYVAKAAQINVGQQQVNVAAPPSEAGGEPKDLPK